MKFQSILRSYIACCIFSLFLFSLPLKALEVQKILDLAPGNWGNLHYHDNTLYVSEMSQNLIYAIRNSSVKKIILSDSNNNQAPDQMIGHKKNLFVATTSSMYLTVINTTQLKVSTEILLRPELIGPSALAKDGDSLYISDVGTQRILNFNFSAFTKDRLLYSRPGPVAMAVSDEKIFLISSDSIFDPFLRSIRVLTADKGQELLHYIPQDHGEIGYYTAIHKGEDGKVYVLAAEDHLCVVFDPKNLEVIKKIPLKLHHPIALTSMNGLLYVLDYGPHSNEIYDTNGQINLKYKPGLEIIKLAPEFSLNEST
ncbi:MAG: hypothetical protein HY072_05110, partial [Deltaproteobacteria bacterium]|nr:hypothetical protein [Deltaproteobacteria bacterium]